MRESYLWIKSIVWMYSLLLIEELVIEEKRWLCEGSKCEIYHKACGKLIFEGFHLGEPSIPITLVACCAGGLIGIGKGGRI